MAVGTTAAIVGASVAIATAVVSASTSGAASAKAKKASREAEKVASQKLEEAKRELQRMPIQELSLDLQGYMSEQEASQVSAAQAIDAAQQGEGRGLAATMGRVQMADIENQRAARLDKVTDLEKLQASKAAERQEASDKLYSLNLAESEGAQVAAAEADNLAAGYNQQIVQSSMQAVQGAASLTGAVLGPKINANEAYKNSVAPMGDAEIKQLMISDPNVSAKYGGSIKISAMTPEQVQSTFMEAYPQDSWEDMIKKLTKQSQGGRI